MWFRFSQGVMGVYRCSTGPYQAFLGGSQRVSVDGLGLQDPGLVSGGCGPRVFRV